MSLQHDPDFRNFLTQHFRVSSTSYTLMLRLNLADDEAFMNKLWFQKWVCDWRGWDADMHRLRRVLDAHSKKGFFCCIFISALQSSGSHFVMHVGVLVCMP